MNKCKCKYRQIVSCVVKVVSRGREGEGGREGGGGGEGEVKGEGKSLRGRGGGEREGQTLSQ